jgi:hypothetical protein
MNPFQSSAMAWSLSPISQLPEISLGKQEDEIFWEKRILLTSIKRQMVRGFCIDDGPSIMMRLS